MSKSSKEERKTTNLSKERGRETSFTLSAAQILPFFNFKYPGNRKAVYTIHNVITFDRRTMSSLVCRQQGR